MKTAIKNWLLNNGWSQLSETPWMFSRGPYYFNLDTIEDKQVCPFLAAVHNSTTGTIQRGITAFLPLEQQPEQEDTECSATIAPENQS